MIDISDLFLDDYDYDDWFVPPVAGDEKVPPMSLPEGEEDEKTEEKGLNVLTPNKLLTRLPILLAQIKAGNNSCKLKKESKQILYLLYQHDKINNKV